MEVMRDEETAAWMERLRDWCEEGLKVDPREYKTSRVTIATKNPEATYSDKPYDEKSYRFVTVVNDRVDPDEGDNICLVTSPEMAALAFRESWKKFREQFPGNGLLWRRPPHLIERYDVRDGQTYYFCRARAVIVPEI